MKTSNNYYKEIHEFYELQQLYHCIDLVGDYGEVTKEGVVAAGKLNFPIYSFRFGAEDKSAPTLVLCGGIHGLERISTHVLTAYLSTTIQLLRWNGAYRESLSAIRLLFYPLANPAGMFLGLRSNANGVDLMRNSPTNAEGPTWPLVSGHRISRRIPWYRGGKGAKMELEAEILCRFIKRECFQSRCCIVLDVHSGFGLLDRLWFPFAHSQKPFPDVAAIYALKELFDQTYPSHVYHIEPQSHSYTAHGDLWDYLYGNHRNSVGEGAIFLPLSLEMGSWLWIKKNPRQLVSSLGIFNPLAPHRLKRTIRRHLILLDFLLKAIQDSASWAFLPDNQKALNQKASNTLWY